MGCSGVTVRRILPPLRSATVYMSLSFLTIKHCYANLLESAGVMVSNTRGESGCGFLYCAMSLQTVGIHNARFCRVIVDSFGPTPGILYRQAALSYKQTPKGKAGYSSDICNDHHIQSLSSSSSAGSAFFDFFSFFSFFDFFLRFRSAFSSAVSPSCLFRFLEAPSPLTSSTSIDSPAAVSTSPLGATGGAERTSLAEVVSAVGCSDMPFNGAL